MRISEAKEKIKVGDRNMKLSQVAKNFKSGKLKIGDKIKITRLLDKKELKQGMKEYAWEGIFWGVEKSEFSCFGDNVFIKDAVEITSYELVHAASKLHPNDKVEIIKRGKTK